MKKIFMVACLMTFAFMVSAQGQGGQGRGFQQTPEQRAAWYDTLKKEAKLTDAKLNEVKKIEEDYLAKMQAARQGGNFDRDAMMKLRDEQNAKVKAALTADQFKKYEELQAAQRQRMGGGGNR